MRISSYLLKLVILTMMVGTFPVLTLGWYSYHHSSRSVLEQVAERNSQVLRQSQLRVEQTLRIVDYSTSQILGLPIISRAIAQDLGIRDVELIQELYRHLNSIQTYELGIRDVYLLSLEQDWFISNAGMEEYSYPGLKEEIGAYSDMQQGSIWINGNSIQAFTDVQVMRNSVIGIKKWPINSTNPRGLIAVVVSSQQLNQLLASDSRLGSTFILDEYNRVIGSNEIALGTDLSEETYISKIKELNDLAGEFNDVADGEEASISFRKSSYNDWTYISLVPTAAITQQVRSIGWTSILVSAGVMAATVIVALIGSRRMYSPVRRISRSLLDDKESREKKDEIVAISDRIQGILSDQSKLQFELKGQQQQLVELLVRKMMLGEAKPKEITERLKYYGYSHVQHWQLMRILIFHIESLQGKRFTENDRDLLLFAISNIASELVVEGQRLPPVVMQESVVLLIGTNTESEEAFKGSVFNVASKVQSSVKGYLQLQTSIGISRSFRQWEEAARGYREGDNALKYRARLGEEAILFIEDVQPDKGREIIYPKELEEELTDAIKFLDSDRARKALSTLMQEFIKQDYDHNDYQIALVTLLIDLLRLLQDSGISLHWLKNSENSLFEELLRLHTSREIEAWFEDNIIVPSIQLLDKRRQTQFKTISQEIIRIINEAFDTDLTLEKCAARINYHPQYISRVFRQEVGVNFNEYLAQYRLEVAKRWLIETDLTITEIALKLKYNNPANFIRYFRKIEGVTPGQYRERTNDVK